MLAGGPSLSYARALAGQPQHAILLTGYQDEESPGRRLQAMAVEGQGTLKLGKSLVDVQCHLGTYALSAHADEGQLLSLTETLDPASVLLVHGDEPARESLTKALRERGRHTILPQGGQAFEFSFRPSLTRRTPRGIGGKRPLDLRVLWEEVASPGGKYFTLSELARAWWEDETRSTSISGESQEHERASLEQRVEELRDALEKDDSFFVPYERRDGLVRARTKEQIELSQMCAREMARILSAIEGKEFINWLVILRDAEGEFRPARVTSNGKDRFWVEGEETARFPEEVIEVLGAVSLTPDFQAILALEQTLLPHIPPALDAPCRLDDIIAALPPSFERDAQTKAAVALALLRAGATKSPEGYRLAPPPGSAPVEPNQALALVRASFPPAARLRRVGYRLDQHILVLTFDFPLTVRERFDGMLARLESETRWKIEIDPETNQVALVTLAREVLPQAWEIVKGPSIYREAKRVSLTARGGEGELAIAVERFRQVSGYMLSVHVAESLTSVERPAVAVAPTHAAPLEINAANELIRQTLAGSTLYRTSLRGSEIMLSFISPQVGTRYRQVIEALSLAIGWPLTLNPNPNQNALLEAAQRLVTGAGWLVTRGPSIHTD